MIFNELKWYFFEIIVHNIEKGNKMSPIVQQIAAEFKAELQKLYGEELSALVLFGSHAKGDFKE